MSPTDTTRDDTGVKDGESRGLRVLQICHDYQGPFVSVCDQYARAFDGHDVTTLYICGRRDERVIAQTGGGEVRFLEQPSRSMRGLKLRTMFKIARLFRERAFDVVIAHRYKPIYFAGVMSYFFPIRVLLAVVHEHEVFRRQTRKLFITFWRRNIICVGVSRTVSRDIEHYCGPLSSRGRLVTLPHALDVARASAVLSRDESRRKLGVAQDAFCFGTVGRLVAKKHHEVLLAAFRQFLDAYGGTEACLLIVGAGPEEGRLRQYAGQHHMESCVRFTGHVDDAYRYFAALDIFVFSSGSAEAFGMVLLEAMLSSVPIVSSDAPGPAEVVQDTALLFKTGNAGDLAGKLLAVRHMTPQARARLGRSGHERLLQEYSLQAFRRRIWDIPELGRVAVGRD